MHSPAVHGQENFLDDIQSFVGLQPAASGQSVDS
jgi:hypothetical protein